VRGPDVVVIHSVEEIMWWYSQNRLQMVRGGRHVCGEFQCWLEMFLLS